MSEKITERIVEITELDDPRVEVFHSLTERQLRSAVAPLIVVESPKVIKVALDAGLQPEALLCERRHIVGDAADIIARCPDMPVYTGSREMLSTLTGYTLTRGVLCAMRRPQLPSVEEICKDARRLAVIDGVCDTTNIGAIFRSAAALGMDGVALTPTSCDPLNRRSIRVSMGSVFLVPWTFLPLDEHGKFCDPTCVLNRYGFKTAALALTDRSVSIEDIAMNAEAKLAVILGTEGEGLDQRVIEAADYTARIPMSHGVDSLNVAAAAAVAFWQLRR